MAGVNEEWRDVPGYEGIYQVSDQGQIKRVLINRGTSGGIISSHLNNSGYLRVHLTRDGKTRMAYVHHLVAKAFLGPRPDGCDVNHRNGVKTDNHASNLDYMTRAENMRHAREHGLHDNRGEKQWNAKLTKETAVEILWAHNTCGISAMEIAPSLHVAIRTVKDVLERKTWRHVNWP